MPFCEIYKILVHIVLWSLLIKPKAMLTDMLLLFGETHCLPVQDNSSRDGPISAFQNPISSMLLCIFKFLL